MKIWLYNHLIDYHGKFLSNRLLVYFITILIVLNVISVILESHKELIYLRDYFFLFELFSVSIFTFEYLIRIWIADLVQPEVSKFKARINYIFSIMGLVDLIAILPFYIPIIFSLDGRIFRILRLLRLLRVFKISHYDDSLLMLFNVLKSRLNELFVTMFTVIIILILASTIMYEIEHEIQPEAFPNILSTLWWAIATLTTIGYGDVYPVTAWGKFLASITALLGIGLIAIPTGIISAGFLDELRNKKGSSYE